MGDNDMPLGDVLHELNVFMEMHKISSSEDPQEWGRALNNAIDHDPRVLDNLAVWLHYAMAAGYERGYNDGLDGN